MDKTKTLENYSTLELELELEKRGLKVLNTVQKCPTCNGK